MIRYVVVSLTSGLLFGILDGLINANPIAVNLYSVYEPIMRTSVNAPAGIMIDLMYGFILAGIFIMLRNSLPGKSGIMKGLNYGLLMWFFRVMIGAASSWMMFNIPTGTLFYGLIAGLGEMVVLGLFYGVTLKA